MPSKRLSEIRKNIVRLAIKEWLLQDNVCSGLKELENTTAFYTALFTFYYNKPSITKSLRSLFSWASTNKLIPFYYSEESHTITYYSNLIIKYDESNSSIISSIDLVSSFRDLHFNADFTYYMTRHKSKILQLYPINKYKEEVKKGKWNNITKEFEEKRIVSPGRFINKLNLTESEKTQFNQVFSKAELLFTDDPKEIANIYECGPSSCMKSTSNEARYWSNQKDFFHPTMFYGLIDGLGLLYMKKGNKIIGRAAACLDNKTVGRPFYSNKNDYNTFIKAIKNSEWSQDMDYSKWNVQLKNPIQSIKGIWSEYHKDYLCPIPYMDWVSHMELKVIFDPQTREFNIAFYSKRDNTDHKVDDWFSTSTRVTTGYIIAKQCMELPHCLVCNQQIENVEYKYLDKHSICSANCLAELGYTTALTSEGTVTTIDSQSVVVDEALNRRFTTTHAAMFRAKSTMKEFFNTGLWAYKVAISPIQVTHYKNIVSILKSEHSTTCYDLLRHITNCGRITIYDGKISTMESSVLQFLSRIQPSASDITYSEALDIAVEGREYIEYAKERAFNLYNFTRITNDTLPEPVTSYEVDW